MQKVEKRYPKNLSDVADSKEMTILDENGKVVKVGTWKDLFKEVADSKESDTDGLYRRTAFLISQNRILII